MRLKNTLVTVCMNDVMSTGPFSYEGRKTAEVRLLKEWKWNSSTSKEFEIFLLKIIISVMCCQDFNVFTYQLTEDTKIIYNIWKILVF